MTAANDHDDFEQRMVEELALGVHKWVSEVRKSGRAPDVVDGPEDLAGRMLALLPATHPWDDQIGPFYDTAGLTKLLGISRQAIADRVSRGSLLAATTSDGRVVYPAFQFDGRHVRREVAEVLVPFKASSVDGWAVAAWFTTPATALDRVTPLEWVNNGGNPESVRALAVETVERWAA